MGGTSSRARHPPQAKRWGVGCSVWCDQGELLRERRTRNGRLKGGQPIRPGQGAPLQPESIARTAATAVFWPFPLPTLPLCTRNSQEHKATWGAGG